MNNVPERGESLLALISLIMLLARCSMDKSQWGLIAGNGCNLGTERIVAPRRIPTFQLPKPLKATQRQPPLFASASPRRESSSKLPAKIAAQASYSLSLFHSLALSKSVDSTSPTLLLSQAPDGSIRVWHR